MTLLAIESLNLSFVQGDPSGCTLHFFDLKLRDVL